MQEVLVLSGGGSRGAYQAGVLAAFEETGYRPARIVGTSIGALNGCAFAGGMPMQDCVRLWKTLRTRDILRPRLSLRRPVAPRGLRDILESFDWKRVRDGIPMRVTAVDVVRRSPVTWASEVLGPDHLLASTALPPFFAPVDVHGTDYIDGGLWQNPPIDAALVEHVDSLVVLCHEPLDVHEEPPARSLREQSMALSDVVWHARSREALRALEARRGLGRRHPLHVKVRRVDIVAPAVSTIPDILRFDPAEASPAIEAGRADGHRFLADR